MANPLEEYTKRLAAHQKVRDFYERRHIRIGKAKLLAVVIGVVLLWLVLSYKAVSAWWLVLPGAAYAALATLHEFTLRARARAERAAAYYRGGLARMEDRWMGSGQTGERFRTPKHVYADDLDLFGRGSLFELLCTARLPMGQDQLAAWLKFPSPRAEVLDRQKLVSELRDRLDLREDLAILGESVQSRIEPAPLIAWAEKPRAMPPSPVWGALALVAFCSVAGIGYYFAGGVAWPVLGIFLSELIVLLWLYRRAKEAIAGLECNAEGLQLFSHVLERIEREGFSSPRLRAFAADLRTREGSASRALAKLARVVYWIDSRDNLLARLAELPLLYTVQIAFLAEAWRKKSGAHLRRWAEVAGEVEALLSRVLFLRAHPNDPFPELLDGAPALFEGEELGHPLIPESASVRNSVRLGPSNQLLLVSGSNMSGKSTLLRVVGINAVLAFSGAPVRAKSLRLTPLNIGTRIRSTDSLQEGRSSFFTEILQIREVFQSMNGARPLLFLFDELLEGTNSKDRRIGAESLLGSLLARGAIGIVTTHDLALTEIVGHLTGPARNVHFEDEVSGGEMRFDYKLRDGVVTKSNALALMKIVGLDAG